MRWKQIKLGLWSAIGGAVCLAIIGFSWGGWMTRGSAQEMATATSSAAMVDRLTPLCLVRFNEDPEKDQKLQVLTNTSAWQRRDYVEAQGWATLSGEKEPDSPVAIECLNQIMKTNT